jgi:hypothetical protein
MIDTLLSELDPLSYRQRLRLLAGRARELAAGGRLAQLAAEASGVFEREMVLFLAIVAREPRIVAGALADDSWRLRSRALAACSYVPVDEEALLALLSDAPWAMRKRIYRLVRRERLTTLADRLLAVAVRHYGDAEAAALLAGCSSEVVERELPGLAHAVPNWEVMALAHPEIVLASGDRELAGATAAARRRWWQLQGKGVLALAETHPEAVFDLLERYPADPFPYWHADSLAALGRHDPMRLFTLLDQPESEYARRMLTRPCLLRIVRRLSMEWLAGFLCRHRFGVDVRDRVLKALPPARRAELFHATQGQFQQPDHPTPESTLRVLSHAARVGEARRSLALARVAEDEETTLRYTAFLPFDEAEPALVKATARHLPEERAAGYELLVQCAGRSGDAAIVSRALGMLTRLRNEQDPVRGRAIGALSALPARLFDAGQVPMLAEVTRDAVAARDASMVTRGALGQLAVRILARRSETAELVSWAVSTLDQLYGTGRLPSFGRLDTVLRLGQEQEFFSAVRAWIEEAMARANFWPLFTTARALGRRAWRVDDLQALLASAIHERNTAQVHREAITLWLDDPAQRSCRVETVLRGDASTVAIPGVWANLSTVRTDLLDLVLDGRGPIGKHLAKGTRWVPPNAPHVERWLPRQHRRYLDLLTRVAGDAGADLYRRIAAIRAAAPIPVVGWSLVAKYCGSPNTVLDEAALGALIWTDRPEEALPILLSHVDDDRARVAVYALSRAVRFMAPSTIRPTLVGMLQARKITSRKEAIRLLSAIAPRDAMTDVITVWQPEQHRDVRVAVVLAARGHLFQEQAWRVLDEAAGDAERAIALAVVQVAPGVLPTEHRPRYAALVGRACRHPDPAVATVAWMAYPRWAQWVPGAMEEIADAVCDLTTLTTWRTATRALIMLLDEGFSAGQLRPVFERLLRSDDDGPDGQIDRDRPARQRLSALAREVVVWAQRQLDLRADLTEVCSLGEELVSRPDYLTLGLELMAWSMPLGETVLDRLDSMSVLTENRPLAAHTLANLMLARLDRQHEQLPFGFLRDTAVALASRDSFASGLLALSFLRCAAATPSGWAAEGDRAVLRTLRRHPHADVRELALDEYTREE